MKKKTKKNYKFGDALKAASPLFHAKYGKKGKYEKKGGHPKIGGEGDQPITVEEEAIAAIDECTTEKQLRDVASRIEQGDVLKDNTTVKNALEKKMEEIENAIGSSDEPEDITRESEETNPAPVDLTTVDAVDAKVGEGDVPVPVTETVEEEVGAGAGGKKAKKSAKKGKKSAKKGGKKARKSAKKSRR